MKKYYVLLCGVMLLFMANRQGRPVGVTGAPGESGQVCSSCHNGGNFNANIEISLANTDGDIVSEYIPGQEYDLTVTVSGDNAAGFGFQLVPLTNSNDKMAGEWGNLGDKVRIQEDLSRSYIVQSDRQEEGVFTAKWTAPSEGSGSINFYSAGVAANGNGGTSGDMAAITSISIEEGNSTAVQELDFNITMYPNPTSDYLYIDTEQEVDYVIYSILGESIKTSYNSSKNQVIDVNTLEKGMYMISLTSGDKSSSRWFMKS